MKETINWNEHTIYSLTGLPPDGRRGLQRYRSDGRMILLFLADVLKCDEWHTCTNFEETEPSNDQESY